MHGSAVSESRSVTGCADSRRRTASRPSLESGRETAQARSAAGTDLDLGRGGASGQAMSAYRSRAFSLGTVLVRARMTLTRFRLKYQYLKIVYQHWRFRSPGLDDASVLSSQPQSLWEMWRGH